MGQQQHTSTSPTVAIAGRELCARVCLRKGCGNVFQPRRWNQRYCQDQQCMQQLRRWQAAKRQQRHRAKLETCSDIGRRSDGDDVSNRHNDLRAHRAALVAAGSHQPSAVQPARGHAGEDFRQIFVIGRDATSHAVLVATARPVIAVTTAVRPCNACTIGNVSGVRARLMAAVSSDGSNMSGHEGGVRDGIAPWCPSRLPSSPTRSSTLPVPKDKRYLTSPYRSQAVIHKRILVTDRVRRPPREGFSWVDRRFLREFASRLSREAIELYFFLAAVSDKDGLSFYRDNSIALRLRLRPEAIAAARDELIAHDLVAYQPPLTQLLSLPGKRRVERGGLQGFKEIFRQLAGSGNQGADR